MPVFVIHQLVSATKGSITSDSISESESNEKKETTAEEDVIKSQSQSPSEKEGNRLRFPCSYCSRRFETFEEVKRHVRNGHTPRRTG